jgi:hypothetical protein
LAVDICSRTVTPAPAQASASPQKALSPGVLSTVHLSNQLYAEKPAEMDISFPPFGGQYDKTKLGLMEKSFDINYAA